MFNNFLKIVPFCEMVWKNLVESGTPHTTVWRMHAACWIPKATNTHFEYVILIALPQQKMLAWMHLSVTLYVHCLSCWYVGSPSLLL